ncbi:KilA-N domain-containing protein [Microcoleus sp. MON1_C5]|uniref:KilA-N domain-containing protein n=1 Tax=Microcoleus sp. MON1_C5 TaxID=2818828 RepID=UPI002FD609ED
MGYTPELQEFNFLRSTVLLCFYHSTFVNPYPLSHGNKYVNSVFDFEGEFFIMGKLRSQSMDYKGFLIHCQQNGGLICLTDMWRATGSVKSQELDKWFMQERICKLLLQLVLEAKPGLKPVVERILAEQPVANSGCKKYRAWASQLRTLAKDAGLIKTRGSKSYGTYATENIAIAYAQDLSPEFHRWALTAIKQRIEEDADPELGIRRSRQRAVKTWEKQGKTREYIGARLDSIPKEDFYEAALYEHGVKVPQHFARCKAKGYEPIIGLTKDFRTARGLKQGQNCKDAMTMEELAATDFAKVLSAKRINTLNPNGVSSCASISHSTAQQVAHLLNQ